MKTRLMCASVLCVAAGLAQAAPASKASVEKLFDVQNFDKMMDDPAKAMPASAALMQQSMPDVPADKRQKVQSIINRYMSDYMREVSEKSTRAEIRRVAVEGVQKVYTQEEVDAMIAFYGSPVGRSITAKMPQYIEATMTPMMDVMQSKMQAFQQKNGAKMQREINQAVCGKNTCQ